MLNIRIKYKTVCKEQAHNPKRKLNMLSHLCDFFMICFSILHKLFLDEIIYEPKISKNAFMDWTCLMGRVRFQRIYPFLGEKYQNE